MDPVKALKQVAFHLERAGEPTYRVQAFRTAAAVLADLDPADVEKRAKIGTLTDLKGVGKSTAGVVVDALANREPSYLAKLRHVDISGGEEMRAKLKGDCHVHSDWSDGGSPIRDMAEAARDLGHEFMVLTDHSPRLTVANGLSRERLEKQLEVVAELNAELAPFTVLTGIEVDILDDGSLDQDEDLLARLDVVVASVHSKLKMPRAEMTRRMVNAVRNPHVDVLGHCTGRLVVGKGRPESQFDAEKVFEACAEHGTAVEINSRPERLDPPRRLLSLAVDAGCVFSIDSDAHAPGQLDWLNYGCARAEECGVTPDRVINTRPASRLLSW
ncbi:PHP domain-containing protein [Lentzea sp. NPDC059081]|uniref:PHP domain-containing protein n=1 Tax=Lentzea sp. NPDC059081 TaxID=3346719 RepID=UPI0036AE41C7